MSFMNKLPANYGARILAGRQDSVIKNQDEGVQQVHEEQNTQMYGTLIVRHPLPKGVHRPWGEQDPRTKGTSRKEK